MLVGQGQVCCLGTSWAAAEGLGALLVPAWLLDACLPSAFPRPLLGVTLSAHSGPPIPMLSQCPLLPSLPPGPAPPELSLGKMNMMGLTFPEAHSSPPRSGQAQLEGVTGISCTFLRGEGLSPCWGSCWIGT